MALINQKVTDGERAAIYYHVFGGFDNWVRLYAMADGIKDETEIKGINKSFVYRWKNSVKITNLINETRQRLEQLTGAKGGENEPGEESNTGDNKRVKSTQMVDYSNPVNQARKLNELINRTDDTGEVLDALKVIISTQRADRDAAKGGRAVNAYIPITCNECPLYQRAKKG